MSNNVSHSYKTTAHEYDDILHMNYPLSTSDTVKHPRMSNADRAKIFAPFAALKGYEEALALKEHIVVPKVELSDDAKENLDRQLQILIKELEQNQHPVITLVYFEATGSTPTGNTKFETVADTSLAGNQETVGNYIQFTGKVVKITESSRLLQIVDRKIPLDNIRSIRGDLF